MKIDPRINFPAKILSNLIGQANKLDHNEGKVVKVRVGEWYYEVALTNTEISAFPLI